MNLRDSAPARTFAPHLNGLPSAAQFAAADRRRGRWLALWAIAVVLAVVGALAHANLSTALLPIALIILVTILVLLWHYPQITLYVTLASACLFEIQPISYYSDDLTGQVPFFWNINTIFQRYGRMDFKGIPLNLLEMFLLAAGLFSLLRATSTKTFSLRTGNLFWPILLYILFVAGGWLNGIMTGGDFNISLQEVRSQFYFMVAYLLAVNLVRDRRQVGVLLWTMALCVGLKGVLYTFRRFVTLHGLPLPEQGVGSHEEAFFFDSFIALLPVLVLCRAHRCLQWVMWVLLPFVISGNLACNRRAGTAALAIAVPILLLAAYRALPDRRKGVAALGIFLAVGFSIYYPAYKNSESILAQPARAIRSQFQPDDRDASSNAYRDAENADLMATIHLAPIQGYGYGKRMLHAVPIADISNFYDWWDIITHNQILWIWMRVGTPGFIAFWIMITMILIRAGLTARALEWDHTTCAISLFTIVAVSILVVFGLLDLQLSNYRNMLFTGCWVGALSSLPLFHDRLAATAQENRR